MYMYMYRDLHSVQCICSILIPGFKTCTYSHFFRAKATDSSNALSYMLLYIIIIIFLLKYFWFQTSQFHTTGADLKVAWSALWYQCGKYCFTWLLLYIWDVMFMCSDYNFSLTALPLYTCNLLQRNNMQSLNQWLTQLFIVKSGN